MLLYNYGSLHFLASEGLFLFIVVHSEGSGESCVPRSLIDIFFEMNLKQFNVKQAERWL